MADERGETSMGHGAKGGAKAHGFLGSLKDALLAAGRDDQTASPVQVGSVVAATPAPKQNSAGHSDGSAPPPLSPSAEEAARLARMAPSTKPVAEGLPANEAQDAAAPESPIEADMPPTTRVMRPQSIKIQRPQPQPSPQAGAEAQDSDASPRTVLVRGRQQIQRGTFERDPVVGFLIVVGGPGLGSFRPIFEGNNTVGRASNNRIPLDFGDESISNEAQAYVRYDSNDRSFLFVPNLAKTNVVSVNETRPTGAIELKAMDVITLGRTQVAFVPFCGEDFDWSEISEA